MSLIQNGTNALEQQVNQGFVNIPLVFHVNCISRSFCASFQFAGLDLKQGGPFAAGGR